MREKSRKEMHFRVSTSSSRWRYALCFFLSATVLLSCLPSTIYAFDEDTHYYLKYYLLRKVGFTKKEATIIARADVSTDKGGTRPGFAFKNNNPKWHALTSKEENDNRQDQLWKRAKDALNKPQPFEKKLIPFGQFLHFLEDRFTHEGYGWFYGHFFAGYKPDYLAYYTLASLQSPIEEWLYFMKEFLKLLGRNPNPVSWNDVKTTVDEVRRQNPEARLIRPPEISGPKEVINKALQEEVDPKESIDLDRYYKFSKDGNLEGFIIPQRFSYSPESLERNDWLIADTIGVIENSPYFQYHPEASIAVGQLCKFTEWQSAIDPSIEPLRHAIKNIIGLAQDDDNVLNEAINIAILMLDSVFSREAHISYLRAAAGLSGENWFMNQAYWALEEIEPEILKMETNPSDVDFSLLAVNLAKAWEFLRDAEFFILWTGASAPSACPEVDQQQWRIITSADSRLEALLRHAVDAAEIRSEDVDELEAAGFTIIEKGSAFCAFTGPYNNMPGAIGIVNAFAAGPLCSSNRAGKVLGRADRYESEMEVNKWILPEYIDTLNPLTASTDSAWQVLDLVMEDLVTHNPYTMEYMWWAAEGMPTVEYWIGPGRSQIGGNEAYDAPFDGAHYDSIPVAGVTEENLVGDDQLGTVTTWTLRPGMYWHDSDPGPDGWFGSGDDGVVHPVTVADAEFGFNLLKYQENVNHISEWQYIYAVEPIDAYTFKIYEERRSWFSLLDHEVGLLTPKHIWEPYIGTEQIHDDYLAVTRPDGTIGSADCWDYYSDAPENYAHHHGKWRGWQEAYMEDPLRPGWDLTYLIGFGPFTYHHGGWEQGVSVCLEANHAHLAGHICPADINFNQRCEPATEDVNKLLSSIGSYGAPNYRAECDTAYPAQIVDLSEIRLLVDHLGHYWGPDPVPPGFVRCPGG
ncbi:MAG: ABC transporter substrate-binding protein [Candidatus Bathyarchaeota archaeon]|nr:ABC transporter substrate-binding protein [Candidatus Bathyarchaeota archaeon]